MSINIRSSSLPLANLMYSENKPSRLNPRIRPCISAISQTTFLSIPRTIAVSATPGVGSTFVVRLPVADAATRAEGP